jgi:hypothetical protein
MIRRKQKMGEVKPGSKIVEVILEDGQRIKPPSSTLLFYLDGDTTATILFVDGSEDLVFLSNACYRFSAQLFFMDKGYSAEEADQMAEESIVLRRAKHKDDGGVLQ